MKKILKVTLDNKIELRNSSRELREIILNKLMVENPKFIEALNSGRSTYGINRYINNFDILPDDTMFLPRGIRKWLINTIEELNIKHEIFDKRTKFNHVDIDSSMIQYKPYQYVGIIGLIKTGPEGILVSPGGSGKTVMGLSLIPLLGQPTLWLTHTTQLLKQAEDRANFFLPDIGKIGRIGVNKWDIGDLLTIGTIQTISRNKNKIKKDQFGLVVLDEAHHCPASTFFEVLSLFSAHFRYGLTATPYRRDGLEEIMYQTVGEDKTVILLDRIKEHGGIILPTVICRKLDSEPVNTNDINYLYKNKVIKNERRNKIIVKDIVREAKEGNYCIVVSKRKKHCEVLKKLILKDWANVGIATGDYTKKVIDEEIKKLNNKEINVFVCTPDLLGEGFDVDFLNRLFIAMPIRNESTVEQLLARVQRVAEDKKDAYVYDYLDENIGVFKSQFFSKSKPCRYKVYKRLDLNIINR